MNEKIQELINIAKTFFPVFQELYKDFLGEREGLYLAIATNEGDIHGEIIGALPEEKMAEKEFFAKEKVQRMRTDGLSCSFEEDDPENKKYGGGINTGQYFIAPSGLPPHLDQKFAILIAIMADELPGHQHSAINLISAKKVNLWREKSGQQALDFQKF